MNEHKHSIISWSYVVAAILAILLLGAVVWFSLDIFSLNKQGILAPAVSRINHPMAHHGTLSANQIEGWMTFRYVEHVCGVPQSYIEKQLGTSTAIPQNDTLSKYANENNLNSVTLVESVRRAVATYLSGSHS
jgi:hypothetical protein